MSILLSTFSPSSISRDASPAPLGDGRFGPYGGADVPPCLRPALEALTVAYEEARQDPAFLAELPELLAHYAGRPTPLTEVPRFAADLGGARVFLKREDLLHTGAHKLNNALGQALLARRMGRRRLIAETGAGQHGVATATAAARLGLECTIFMGAHDARRQALNVFRMELLGAQVVQVRQGAATLREAVDAALEHFAGHAEESFYLLGSAVGPHPYPSMVREFQKVIGVEARQQILEQVGVLPDAVVACVGGGSNAIGAFHAFRDDSDTRLVGVEGGGRGDLPGEHAARFRSGRQGTIHGMRTIVLQDAEGTPYPTHSISAGMDYPGVGPEHAFLRDTGRAQYVSVSDGEALEAFRDLARLEGILPALESAHAVAAARRTARECGPDGIVVVNLSGRGDKDVSQVAECPHSTQETPGAFC